MHRRNTPIAAALVVLLSASAAGAQTITIDSGTAGTIYDGILDGIPPFPPPGAPPDGVGDSQATPLAVALKSGVVEERAIAEFPLAPLAGLSAADISSATLTLNIDDVIGTFWPGADFDNVASASIIVFTYSGDGSVDLGDFQNVAGTPAGMVDTTPLGVISDATLLVRGPLQFDVDLTTRVRNLLQAGATHLGVVFVTGDDNTATSLDDLGIGGAGPSGVGGAILPRLTVVAAPPQPPNWGKAQLGCQKALVKSSTKLGAATQKSLAKCFDAVLAATAKGKPLTDVSSRCVADLAPNDAASKVGKAVAKLESALVSKCESLSPVAIGTPCNEAAASFSDIASCVVAQQLNAAAESMRAVYGPACALITAVGLDAAYPAACN